MTKQRYQITHLRRNSGSTTAPDEERHGNKLGHQGPGKRSRRHGVRRVVLFWIPVKIWNNLEVLTVGVPNLHSIRSQDFRCDTQPRDCR